MDLAVFHLRDFPSYSIFSTSDQATTARPPIAREG